MSNPLDLINFDGKTARVINDNINGNLGELDNRTSNIDNTSDIDKPVSNAQQLALNSKLNSSDFNPSAFATASQGVKADTALQPSIMGVPNGTATLDSSGKVSTSQLPSYVDDVIEVATHSALPVTGESSKIYIVIADETSGGNTTQYRWSGSAYILISNNMSASDIKTLYESNSDTNAFTDAEKTKLSNIGSATEAVAGLIRKQTQAEAEAGFNNDGAMSALRVAQYSKAFGYTGNAIAGGSLQDFNTYTTDGKYYLLSGGTNEPPGDNSLNAQYWSLNVDTYSNWTVQRAISVRDIDDQGRYFFRVMPTGGAFPSSWIECYTNAVLDSFQNTSGATINSNDTVAGSALTPAQTGTWRNISGNGILDSGYGLFKRV